jgi:hypothetical protein
MNWLNQWFSPGCCPSDAYVWLAKSRDNCVLTTLVKVRTDLQMHMRGCQSQHCFPVAEVRAKPHMPPAGCSLSFKLMHQVDASQYHWNAFVAGDYPITAAQIRGIAQGMLNIPLLVGPISKYTVHRVCCKGFESACQLQACRVLPCQPAWYQQPLDLADEAVPGS